MTYGDVESITPCMTHSRAAQAANHSATVDSTMAGARRKDQKITQLTSRIDNVEGQGESLWEELETVKRDVGRTKRKADKMSQPLFWVIEGSQALEDLYVKCVERQEGGWKQVKQDLPSKLCEEVATHLQLGWPIKKGEERKEEDGDEWAQERKEAADALETWVENLDARIIRNVQTQTRKAGAGRERIAKVFTIEFAPCH
eukprot:12414071-Karenia_brevis.AAC.1